MGTSKMLVIGLMALTIYMFFLNKEGYRDPIYLNRQKYLYDIYPRANGSIYGYHNGSGLGSWHLFSGFPLYPTVY